MTFFERNIIVLKSDDYVAMCFHERKELHFTIQWNIDLRRLYKNPRRGTRMLRRSERQAKFQNLYGHLHILCDCRVRKRAPYHLQPYFVRHPVCDVRRPIDNDENIGTNMALCFGFSTCNPQGKNWCFISPVSASRKGSTRLPVHPPRTLFSQSSCKRTVRLSLSSTRSSTSSSTWRFASGKSSSSHHSTCSGLTRGWLRVMSSSLWISRARALFASCTLNALTCTTVFARR